MTKYEIEGQLNFQEELKKMLDDTDNDDDNDANLCKITGLPLDDKYAVKLDCGHNFNYDALFKEIFNRRYKYKNYFDLQHSDLKIINMKRGSVFIICPYCRKIHFMTLPYYEELGYQKIYGLNSENDADTITNNNCDKYLYGVTFQLSIKSCGKENCKNHCIAKLQCNDTDLMYCYEHYKYGMMLYKQNMKNKIKMDKEKKLVELNALRVASGKQPLKRLPTKTVKTDNTVNMCSAILKSGKNKGSTCKCKAIKDGLFCGKHTNKNINE